MNHFGSNTWRDGHPKTREIVESERRFRLVCMQKFRSGLLPSREGKQRRNCRPLAASHSQVQSFAGELNTEIIWRKEDPSSFFYVKSSFYT